MTQELSRIHRHAYQDKYSILPNQLFENEKLSWGAKGLLAYLLSRPSDWVVYRSQLSKIYKGEKNGSGKYAVDSFFEELMEYKFIIYTAKDPETGRYIHRYDVYPEPQDDFQKNFPKHGFPCMDETKNGETTRQQRNDLKPSNEEEQKKEPVVVLPDKEDFEDLAIPDKIKARIVEEHPQKIKRLVQRIKRWRKRESDLKALWVILRYWDSWNDEKNIDEILDENSKLLKKLKPFDDKKVKDYYISLGKRLEGEYLSITKENFYIEFLDSSKEMINDLKTFFREKLAIDI